MAVQQGREVVVVAHSMSEVYHCSIIIPVLNEAEHLREQLVALQKWRDIGHEVIVVDGGSDDASTDIALPLADEVVVAAKGRAAQMNKGALLAQHSWLVFLHIDTVFPETAMDSMQQLFKDDAIRWGRFNIRLSGDRFLFKVIAKLMNLRSRLTGIATGDQVIFVRKETFNKVGGFPEIALMEDIGLSSRLRKIAWPHCNTDIVTTSSRRWRNNGVIRTVLLMWSLRLRYYFGANPAVLAERYNRAPK